MPINHSYLFTHTVIDIDKLLSGTHNEYRVVSTRRYSDKKGILPEGISVTLQIIKDDIDYGYTKTGEPRENNLYQNFDVTILDASLSLAKGDIIQLIDFVPEHSFAVGFDLLLRFKSAKVLKPAEAKGTKANA